MSDKGIIDHIRYYHRDDLSEYEIIRRFNDWIQYQAAMGNNETTWQRYHDGFLHFQDLILGYTPHTHAHLPVVGGEYVDGEPTGKIIIITPALVPNETSNDVITTTHIQPNWIVKQTINQTTGQILYHWTYEGYSLLTHEARVPNGNFTFIPQPTVDDLNAS